MNPKNVHFQSSKDQEWRSLPCVSKTLQQRSFCKTMLPNRSPCKTMLPIVNAEGSRSQRKKHIPSDLVVALRFSHHTLALSMRYRQDISSAPTALCMEMRHGTHCQSDTRKPHDHRRFPQRSDLRPAP